MDSKTGFPTVMKLFARGFGEESVQTLVDSIEHYAQSMEVSGYSVCAQDVNNISNLVWLLKAVLKDVHGLDIK